jgi:hypothetical protein
LSLMDFKEARIEGTILHYQHGHFLLSVGWHERGKISSSMIVTHCLQVIWVSNEFIVCQCFLWLIWNCENDFKFGKEVFHMILLIWIYQFVNILWSWNGNIIVLKLGNRKSSMDMFTRMPYSWGHVSYEYIFCCCS